jgi:hypothetical protein
VFRMELWRSILTLWGCCGLILLVAYIMRLLLHADWRLAVLAALVVLGGLVWLFTETLSAVGALSLRGLVIAWGTTALAAGVIAGRLRAVSGQRVTRARPPVLRHSLNSSFRGQDLMLGYVLVCAFVLAVIGFVTAPNTWDALTYHLSRVMHWQQDQSLAFYPTAIQRQLSLAPYAEMVLLNFQILCGSDRLAYLVQFLAMIGCLIGVSLTVERLGGGPKVQLFAALATISLPMGILQSTSTQNDYVVALWCVCFAVFVLVLRRDAPSHRFLMLAGISLGLASLTKATAPLYLVSFGVWFVFDLIRRLRFGAWKPLLMVIGTAIAIASPHALRNFSLYGNPLGTFEGPELEGFTNQSLSPSVFASNLLRNLGSQFATPIDALNRGMGSGIQRADALMGIDVNDPRATLPGTQFEVVFSMHEDSAGNLLHAIVILVCVALLIRRRRPRLLAYTLCVGAGFTLFSLVLKWQPWGSRLELPLFVLSMPLVGVVVAASLPGRGSYLLATILAGAALPYMLANPSKPLIGPSSILLQGRLSQYFTNVPDSFSAYDAVARSVTAAGCSQIGMVTRIDGREYLAWVMIRSYEPDAQFEHVLVRNLSNRYPIAFAPCAILVMNSIPSPRMVVQDRTYTRVFTAQGLDLFLIGDYSP